MRSKPRDFGELQDELEMQEELKDELEMSLAIDFQVSYRFVQALCLICQK